MSDPNVSPDTLGATASSHDEAPLGAPVPDAEEDTLGSTEAAGSSAEKDPSEWVTGDETMTGPQRSYLDTLAREAGEELSANLTKAEASEQIDRLQDKTGRGND